MQSPDAKEKAKGVTIGGFLQLLAVFTFLVLSQISLVFAPSGGVEIIRNSGVSKEVEHSAAIAVENVKAFFMDKYNVQLRRNIRIILTSDTDDYIQAQMKEHKISGEEAIRRGRTSSASSQGSVIILNAGHPRLASSPSLIATITHEVVHQFQDQLTNGRMSGSEWLTEGMAGIIAVQLTEDWGGKSLASYKKYCLKEIGSAAALPGLEELSTSKQWRASLDKYGASVTYRIAEVAVLELQSSTSWDAFVSYYQLVNQAADKGLVFERNFGVTLDNFEHQFTEKLMIGK